MFNRKTDDAKNSKDNAQVEKTTEDKIHTQTPEDSQFFDDVGIYALTNIKMHHFTDPSK